MRPAFTLGGAGGGIAHDREGLRRMAENGLRLSPITQVMLEESVAGWHEFELEVMRDRADNVVIICSIENVDPMGVHTGDSVTVAPALTLTDGQYQELRDAAKAIIRKIGVDTGGSNVQFAVQPETGEVVVIEMNPRVSRSSALASKATGFPIAKIAAKLAVGYTLDEIPNDITRKTPASFEPTLDYIVVKMPRWAFEKFPMADTELTTHMKSVGEAMAIGRTFKEAFLKAMRSRELDAAARAAPRAQGARRGALRAHVRALRAHPARLPAGLHARRGLHALTTVPRFFLAELGDIVGLEAEARRGAARSSAGLLRRLKRYGFSDRRLGELYGHERSARCAPRRLEHGIVPVYKAVDTCAAEFEAETPYFYSTYEDENEALARRARAHRHSGQRPQPHRPGHRVRLLLRARRHDRARERVRRRHGQLQPRDRLDRLRHLRPPLLRAADLRGRRQHLRERAAQGRDRAVRRPDAAAHRPRARGGRHPHPGHAARRRSTWPRTAAASATLLDELGISCPTYGVARARDEALAIGERIGYPCLVRPSYVLGGRAMEIVYSSAELSRYVDTAVSASPDHPILIDKFLEDAIEVDVDALSDGDEVYIGGIMQHVEEAGVHSGDSSCVLPSISLGEGTLEQVRRQTRALARALGVKGLMNVQYAYQQLRALRARGQPAGLAHRALREQGHRRAARQARHPHHPRGERSPSSTRRIAGCRAT